MKILSDWGITSDWWQGLRGEYWVIAQVILLIVFILVPPIELSFIELNVLSWQYTSWTFTAIFGILGIVFLVRSVFDLGQNITPLPHPRDDGQLVITGIYGTVRHPIYSGVIYLSLAYASWQMSWVHFIGGIILLVFFDAKARTEEAWLCNKFPEYPSYCASVKKLIPWIY
jgi:protein-S-isoprenylcysteine O-methyltransferase Ste14